MPANSVTIAGKRWDERLVIYSARSGAAMT